MERGRPLNPHRPQGTCPARGLPTGLPLWETPANATGFLPTPLSAHPSESYDTPSPNSGGGGSSFGFLTTGKPDRPKPINASEARKTLQGITISDFNKVVVEIGCQRITTPIPTDS